MRLGSFVFISALSFVAFAGCGKGAPKNDSKPGSATLTSASAPKGGSCLQDKAGTCTDYAENPLGLSESACKDLIKGTYSKDSCPQTNLLGVCEKKSSDKRYFYFGGAYPWVSDARDACEKDGLEPGKFTAQPNAEQTAKDKAMPNKDRIQGSCVSSSGTCDDLYGEMFDMQKSMCEQFDGKFSTSPCSSDRLVGSCIKNGKVERLYEKDLKFQKLSDVQNSCEKYAVPFGHFYPNPDYKAADAPAKKKKKKKATP